MMPFLSGMISGVSAGQVTETADRLFMTAAERVRVSGVSRSLADFGAVGNGVADDTGAILDACETVGAEGGTLIIPPKTYRFSTIDFNVATGKTFALVGHGATLLSTYDGQTGGKRTFCARGGAGAIIRMVGFTLDHVAPPDYRDGNGVGDTSALDVRSAVSNTPMLLSDFDGVTIASSWWGGIRPYLAHYTKISNCRVNNCRGSGLFVGAFKLFIASDNIVSNTSDDGIYAGHTINMGPAGAAIISKNYVSSVGAKGVATGGHKSVILSNNTIAITKAHGLAVHSGTVTADYLSTVQAARVEGNIVIDAGQDGTVSGARSGIHIRAPQEALPAIVQIHGNSIINARERGILSSGGESLDISSNYITATQPAIRCGVDGITHGVVRVHNNTLVTQDAFCVELVDVANFAEDDNRIYGYTTTAFYLNGCTGPRLGSTELSLPRSVYTNINSTGISYTRTGPFSGFNASVAAEDTSDPPRRTVRPNGTEGRLVIDLAGVINLSGTISDGIYIGNLGVVPEQTQYVPVSVYNGTLHTIATLQVRNNNNGEVRLYGHTSTDIQKIYLNGATIRLTTPS